MERGPIRRLALALLAALAAAACAPKDNLVVVLPEDNGHVGAVVVHDAQGTKSEVLDKPYAAAGAYAGATAVQPVTVDSAEVKKIFGNALSAQPIPPASFMLYFESGSDVLTPPSRAAVEEVFKDIARRKAAEVVVTGFTDTVGGLTENDALSRERAETVRRMLIARGLPAGDATAVGRGKRELLVPTADQVSEPRNRRVVVTVR